MSDNIDPIEAVIKDLYERMERIEQNIDYARFDIQEQRIDELKERVEGLYKSIHGIAPDQADVNTEVLQELIENLRINDLLDCYLPKKLLEKLDVGSARQTVCKHNFEIREEFEICTLCGHISPKRIETEKKELKLSDLKNGMVYACDFTDSGGELNKSKCCFCGRDLILYKDKWICGHGCTKPAIKAEERLPDATGQGGV